MTKIDLQKQLAEKMGYEHNDEKQINEWTNT